MSEIMIVAPYKKLARMAEEIIEHCPYPVGIQVLESSQLKDNAVVDRYQKTRPGYAGAGPASSSGNSIANPAAIALIDASYKPFVASATVEIAAAVVLTAILVPLITAFVAKRYGRGEETPFSSSEGLAENMGR